jgi:hypothetical protein
VHSRYPYFADGKAALIARLCYFVTVNALPLRKPFALTHSRGTP